MNVRAQFHKSFTEAIADEIAHSGMPVDDWYWSGVSKPQTEVERWGQLGPQVVQNYIDWFESSGYEVWTTPDDLPAIELPLEVKFGDITVRMVIDAVLSKPDHLLVQDSKSGAKQPESGLQQVGLYACGLELAYGIRPEMGSYFMGRGMGKNRDVFLTEPQWLGAYELSIEFFTEQFEAMMRGIEADAFVANVGKQCNRCFVASSCAAVGGSMAYLFDPDHHLYVEE